MRGEARADRQYGRDLIRQHEGVLASQKTPVAAASVPPVSGASKSPARVKGPVRNWDSTD